MKRLLLITLLIGYIYPCVAQDKPIRTEESLEGTAVSYTHLRQHRCIMVVLCRPSMYPSIL